MTDEELLREMVKQGRADELTDEEMSWLGQTVGIDPQDTAEKAAILGREMLESATPALETVKDIGLGVAQGIPLIGQWTDEFTAAVMAAINAKDEEEWLDAYKRILKNEVRPEFKAAAERSPWLYHGAEIATGILGGGLLAKGAMKLGTGLAGKLGKYLATGFAPEFIAGIAGASEADILGADVNDIKQIGVETGLSYLGGKLLNKGFKLVGDTGSLAFEMANSADKRALINKAYQMAKEGLPIIPGKVGLEKTVPHVMEEVNQFNKKLVTLFQEQADKAKVLKDEILDYIDAENPMGLPKEDIQNVFQKAFDNLRNEAPKHKGEIRSIQRAASEIEEVLHLAMFKKPRAEMEKIVNRIYDKAEAGAMQRFHKIMAAAQDPKLQGKIKGMDSDLLDDFILRKISPGDIKDELLNQANFEAKALANKYKTKQMNKMTAREVDGIRDTLWKVLNYDKATGNIMGQEVSLSLPGVGGIKDQKARKHVKNLIDDIKNLMDEYDVEASHLDEAGKTFTAPIKLSQLNKEIHDAITLKDIARKTGYRGLTATPGTKRADESYTFFKKVKEAFPEVDAAIQKDLPELQMKEEVLGAIPVRTDTAAKLATYQKVGAVGAIEGLPTKLGSVAGSIQRSTRGLLDNMEFTKAVLGQYSPGLVRELVNSAFAGDEETLAQIGTDIAPQMEEFMEPSPVKARGVRIKSAFQSPRFSGAFKIGNPQERALLASDIMDDKNLSEAQKLEMVQTLHREGVLMSVGEPAEIPEPSEATLLRSR